MVWVVLGIAFVALLIAFPRQVLAIVGVCVALVAGLLLWISGVQEREQAERNSVTIDISYDAKGCSETHPIMATVSNGSRRTLLKVEWNVQAFRPGYSSDLAESRYHEYSSDKILEANTGVVLCYQAPTLPSDVDKASLTYKSASVSPSFQK